MAEFPTEEHREAYLNGLALEREGYVQRAGGATSDAERAHFEAHVAQVDAERDRIVGTPEEKPQRRPKAAAETR